MWWKRRSGSPTSDHRDLRKYGGASVIINNDQRLKDLGITAAIQANIEDSYIWDFNQAGN